MYNGPTGKETQFLDMSEELLDNALYVRELSERMRTGDE